MSINFNRVDFCGVAEGGALHVAAVGSHVGNGSESWVELQMRIL
jgi:hypothetical protein